MAYIAEPNATVSWNGQCGQRIMLLMRCIEVSASTAVSQAMAANSTAPMKVRIDRNEAQPRILERPLQDVDGDVPADPAAIGDAEEDDRPTSRTR